MGSEKQDIDYKELIDNLVDITLITDSNGCFSWVSHQVKDILGYDPEEVIGKDALEYIHEEDLELALNGLQKVLEDGFYSIKYRVKHKDGHYIHFHGTGRMVIKDDDIKIIAQIKDITDIVEVERLLNEVGEISKIGGWEMDLITRKAKWTRATYDIVEIDHDAPIPGLDEHVDYYLPSYRNMIDESMKELIENGKELDFVAEAITAKGRHIWCRVIGRQSENVNGKCIRIKGTIQNITERIKVQKNFEGEKERAELYLDLLSHDIGNLHQGIASFAQIARMTCRSDCDAKQHIISIEEIAKRSQNLINNVKLLSKIETLGKEIEPVDLNTALLDSVSITRKMFTSDNINIMYEPPSTKLMILAEPIVQNIFVNLIHNGLKAQLGNEMKIGIKAEIDENDQNVIVSISDHGPGIPDDMKKDLFMRRSNSNKKAHTGIGLSLVKELVDRYNGTIKVKDRVDGDHAKGARFDISFPLMED